MKLATFGRWHRSLYVRAAMLAMVIALILFVMFWWPRRTTWAMVRAGVDFDGTGCRDEIDAVEIRLPLFCLSAWKMFRGDGDWLCWDSGIEGVAMQDVDVDDRWMWRLGRCHGLKRLVFNGRQIGPGFASLEHLSEVGWVEVQGADPQSHLEGLLHLRSVIQLRIEEATGPVGGLERLREHPSLTSVRITRTLDIHTIIKQMNGWSNVTALDLYRHPHNEFEPLTETILAMQAMSRLNELTLSGVYVPEDFPLLAKLTEIEELHLYFGLHNEEVVTSGLEHLARLPKLKRLRFWAEPPAADRLREAARKIMPTVQHIE